MSCRFTPRLKWRGRVRCKIRCSINCLNSLLQYNAKFPSRGLFTPEQFDDVQTVVEAILMPKLEELTDVGSGTFPGAGAVASV